MFGDKVIPVLFRSTQRGTTLLIAALPRIFEPQHECNDKCAAASTSTISGSVMARTHRDTPYDDVPGVHYVAYACVLPTDLAHIC